MQMYLKNPDWDNCVDKSPQLSIPGLTAPELELVRASRFDDQIDMWHQFIDGEYLDIRLVGDIPGFYVDDAIVVDVKTELIPGEYWLTFEGGYVDDWLPDFAPWAVLNPSRRDAIKVRIKAVVADGWATATIPAIDAQKAGDS